MDQLTKTQVNFYAIPHPPVRLIPPSCPYTNWHTSPACVHFACCDKQRSNIVINTLICLP